MYDIDKANAEARAQRISTGRQLKAPLRCRPECEDEIDCSSVAICRAVAEVYGEPVDEKAA